MLVNLKIFWCNNILLLICFVSIISHLPIYNYIYIYRQLWFYFSKLALKIKINSGDKTLDKYVSDCIDMNMNTEVGLKYDNNCFGTADAIYADEYENKLYIFDLKTGIIKASMKQLMIYAALFFLEYDYDPEDWYVELRIYQNLEENDINKHIPSPEEICVIMDKITVSSEIINTRSK